LRKIILLPFSSNTWQFFHVFLASTWFPLAIGQLSCQLSAQTAGYKRTQTADEHSSLGLCCQWCWDLLILCCNCKLLRMLMVCYALFS
jgi:hypothetical protein